jgi:hypothetical protein
MKSFDETTFEVKYSGEPFLGHTLSLELALVDRFNAESYKTTRKEFEKSLDLATEWILLDPKDKEFSKSVRGNSLFLDESALEKTVMVHTLVQSDTFSYRGMPFQRQFGLVQMDPKRLAETIEMIYQGQMVPAQSEVDRIYKHFGQTLVDYNAELNRRFKFIVKSENSEFLLHLYKAEKQAETDAKRLRTLNEERLFWKNKCECSEEDLQKAKATVDKLAETNKSLSEQTDFLLEEKNFFMNCKSFKNTELSFLDEQSGELNQTAVLFGGQQPLPPIPVLGGNNTLDFTILDDETNHNEFQREVKALRERLADYEGLLQSFRKEVESYRRLYSQHRIDSLINEHKQVQLKNAALENQLEECKTKLKKYDFANKYMSRELESSRGFSGFFANKGPDESFITVSNVAASLTAELLEKDRAIARLTEEAERLRQFANDSIHNQTF